MSRKLSQQQRKRIATRQQAELKNPNLKDLEEALVISHRGQKVLVEDQQQQTLQCHFRPHLGALVSGDEVLIDRKKKLVMVRKERRSFLQRRDGFGHQKPVAANIDQMLICLSVLPPPNLMLLDQYLAVAEANNIEATILLHKIDLLDMPAKDPFELIKVYAALGYRVLYTSLKQASGLNSLQPLLAQRNSILLGLSGVGKSSIIQALLPHEEIKVGAVSSHNEEGTHTTRSSSIYHLTEGGRLIDTPGVRGFTPILTREEVSSGFREIQEYAAHCRFHNCRHQQEPGCAVLNALEHEQIHPTRYQHFQQILTQVDV